MEEKTVHVPAISCRHCVLTVKREIEELEGVISVDGNKETKEISVRWEAPATLVQITDILMVIGFPAE
ncbi:MAG: heavy-metal-associated domain-containing protein [Candidatus Adiutricales bacterium]